MEPETLIFMPDGDVTLRLTRHVFDSPDPEAEAASSDPRPEAAAVVEPESLEVDEDFEIEELFYAPDAPDSETFAPPPRRARASDASSRRDRSTSPPASFWARLKRQQAEMGETIVEEQPAVEVKAVKRERMLVSSHEVLCVVSSRHMILASRYFERLLGGDSKEAAALKAKKHIVIPLEADWEAMVILLNIVHGISRKVPRQVKLDTLRKLATLVSAFGMIDSVQFFSDTWIDEFQRNGLPNTYDEKVLSLLFVFWVFDRPAEFKNMTKIAQRECAENLDEDVREVPIPRAIIDAIKRDREVAMESAIAFIHKLIDKYLDGKNICDGSWEDELSYACDATILGSLMKSSRKIGIWPKPEAPFPGRKFKELVQAIRSIRVLDVCKKSSSKRLHLLGPSHNSHGLEDSIEAAIREIETGVEGLELAEYGKKEYGWPCPTMYNANENRDDFLVEAQAFIPAATEVVEDQRSEIQSHNTAEPDAVLPATARETMDQPMDEPLENEYSGYMKNEVESLRREYSVSPPAISTQHDFKSVEEPQKLEGNTAPRQPWDSSNDASLKLVKSSIHEASEPARDIEKAISLSSWDQEADSGEETVYELERSITSYQKDAEEPVREHGKASPRNSWVQEAKEPVFQREAAMERSVQNQVPRKPLRESGKASSRDSSRHETKIPFYEQDQTIRQDSREQDAMEYIRQQTRRAPGSWPGDLDEPVHAQTSAGSRESWRDEKKTAVYEQEIPKSRDSRERDAIEYIKQQTRQAPRSRSQDVKKPALEQPIVNMSDSWSEGVTNPAFEQEKIVPRNSWSQHTRDSVTQQRKASPGNSRGQDTRPAPSSTMRSPIEQPNLEVKVFGERKSPSVVSFPKETKPSIQESSAGPRKSSTEQVKALADSTQESNMAPRNSSTERVKAMADRSLHRAPSFTKSTREEARSQQYSGTSRSLSNEEVRALPERKSNSTTSNLREEVKSPTMSKIVSTDEVRGGVDKRMSIAKPFTTSEAKAPSSQSPMATRGASTIEANEDRRPNMTNPFTRPSTNDVKAPLQTQSLPPKVPSREEVAALTNKKLHTTTFFSDAIKDTNKMSSQKSQPPSRTTSSEEVTKSQDLSSLFSRLEKKDVAVPIVGLWDASSVSSDALLSTEDEDSAPQKFNMRKSKKKFQVKY